MLLSAFSNMSNFPARNSNIERIVAGHGEAVHIGLRMGAGGLFYICGEDLPLHSQ